MISLRNLFDKHGVEYRDHGPNTSRGHINVSCPWCGNDPSHHLGINETTGEYYCFRNAHHAGASLKYLFKRLGLPKSTWQDLKLDPNFGRKYIEDAKDYSAWRYFTPAGESQEGLDYLKSRLFLNPEAIAEQFNLRVVFEGQWAGRLLIPMNIGWTGRAMREHIEPRYKAHTNEEGFYFFSNHATSVIIVEGAIDAMRVASVSKQFDVYAKCRISMSAAMVSHIKGRRYQSIFTAPDSSVTYMQAREELIQLRSFFTSSRVQQIKLSRKDFGETPESETRSLLGSVS